MIKKISNDIKFSKQHGGFGIEVLYPGKAMDSSDTGFGTIGRIDQAKVLPGTLVPMHPHQDDEILTYLRNGTVKHKDTEGLTDIISNKRLMMMNAGALFQHEELVLDGEDLQGLQIFLRPEKTGLKPMVQFHDFPEAYSINQWRAIAGKESSFPLQVRSSTWLYDIRMEKNNHQILPQLPVANASSLLYVFEGEIRVNESIVLTRGESVLVERENIQLSALKTSDVVLFITDKHSRYSEEGMYSGNQKKY
jgi:redox-sensitive bicupin YhaK (pirin superfamily)